MSGTIAPFLERYRRGLLDERLRANLLTFHRSWRQTRQSAFDRRTATSSSATFDTTRNKLIGAKNAVLDNPREFQHQFMQRATQAGASVHEVATAADARELILHVFEQRNVRLLAKGKSMVAEEIFLNHHLEAAGIRVVELLA
jgi:L-lactate dehydrogenase complex protein LldF